MLGYFFIKKQNFAFFDAGVVKIKTEKEFLEKELSSIKSENQEFKTSNQNLLDKNAQLKTEYEVQSRELKLRKQNLEETSQKLKLEFENMAQKIFKETAKTYQDTSEKSISNIVQPLKENIKDFHKNVENFTQRQKFLEETITNFKEINQNMISATSGLQQSLTGSVKAQGQWGEILLENILEKSGLRKGEEFLVQSEGLSHQEETTKKLRPDVIVKLPDKKHIIIDSKVSLTHYQDYEKETDKNKKAELKAKVIQSLNQHIQNLFKKDYPSFEGLKTPDFVLMFIPAEPVFSLAIQNLYDKAWEKSIVIVSPITLYATLRTIASIWKIERQNKNAELIASESGLLYNKFVGFLEDMNQIDRGLQTAQDSYHLAHKKLKSGRGNLIQKIENIKKLGAKTNKEIPDSFHEEEPSQSP
ncbi:MAG: DNA recombination protein RmuC [Bdellovibrionales bacterium]